MQGEEAAPARGGTGTLGRRGALLPALAADCSPAPPSERSGRKFMPFGFKKRLLEEKRKEREKENENGFNFFLA